MQVKRWEESDLARQALAKELAVLKDSQIAAQNMADSATICLPGNDQFPQLAGSAPSSTAQNAIADREPIPGEFCLEEQPRHVSEHPKTVHPPQEQLRLERMQEEEQALSRREDELAKRAASLARAESLLAAREAEASRAVEALPRGASSDSPMRMQDDSDALHRGANPEGDKETDEKYGDGVGASSDMDSGLSAPSAERAICAATLKTQN